MAVGDSVSLPDWISFGAQCVAPVPYPHVQFDFGMAPSVHLQRRRF